MPLDRPMCHTTTRNKPGYHTLNARNGYTAYGAKNPRAVRRLGKPPRGATRVAAGDGFGT